MTRPPTLTGRSICPTPTKIRYTSRRDAKREAAEQSQKSGLDLRFYDCVCGFYHLTKSAKTQSAGEPPEIIGIPHVLALNDIEFATLIRFEVQGKLTAAECAIIRHPEIASRWLTALGWIRDEAEADLRRINEMMKSPANAGRRDAKIRFLEQIERRQQEAKQLVRELNIERPKAPNLRSQQRRTAGDRALEALANRHRHEFADIFRREADIIGLALPVELEEVHRRIEVEGLRELHPAELGDQHVPRYPEIHIVLTGQEDFYEIAALVVGAVFRHLRNGDDDLVATYAVIDIVGCLHRTTIRNAEDARHVLGDWVTLHVPFADVASDE